VAWLALSDGTPVYDRRGTHVGVIEYVMGNDIFAGVIVHTDSLPRRHLYADATQISEIRERGVVFSAAVEELHDLRRESRRRADGSFSALEGRVRSALDRIMRP
jgi:uncharacterized protein YrrD